jgi:D-3-phosphoglycerate dehydrogenase
MTDKKFRIGITGDALDASGRTFFDSAAFGVLDGIADAAWEYLSGADLQLSADDLARYDVICVVAPGIRAGVMGRNDRRTKLLARFGVGYDNFDVPALTRAGIALTINPDGVRRPMATVELTYLLALSQRLWIKDKITREGRWNDRMKYNGTGLTGRTLGSIGLGNIGRELFRLAAPLGLRHIAHDPVATEAVAKPLGVTLVDFDTVVRQSDFLAINCPLNTSTRKLVGARVLSMMKPTAFLISCARGPIVDEAALYRALVDGTIAGAGLDVFEQEPTPPDNPLLKLDNVIVSPHALCYTDECLRQLAEGAFRATAAYLSRQRPPHTVNPEVYTHPRQREWFGG